MAERTLIITSSPSHWTELAEITGRAMKAYADRWDYDYFAWVADPKDYYYNPHTKTRDLLPVKGFVKLDIFLRKLPEYDRVVWLDADLLITNPAINVDELTFYSPHQLIIGYDMNAHNTTVIVARASDLMYDFMWVARNTGWKLFGNHDWVEMEAMRYFLQTPPYQGMATYINCKRLCPILHTEYLDAGCPERVYAKYGWEDGDFSLHLSALSLERRIELAREYYARVYGAYKCA